MLRIADFSMPRVILSVGGVLAFLLFVAAVTVWVHMIDPIVPPRRSPDARALHTVLTLTLLTAYGIVLLILTGLGLRAPFRHARAAVFVLGDQAVLFNGSFFRTVALTSVREVNIASREVDITWWSTALRLPSLEVQLEAARSIHVPLRLLRGDPEVIRQRLWDEVQAAKAR